jgi:transcriptional regulator with XRE-family HTH domain
MNEFRERLIFARKKKKLTQGQVAKELGLCRTAYTKYENKKRPIEPSLTTLRRLCLLLNVSADWLLGLTDDKEDPVIDDELSSFL